MPTSLAHPQSAAPASDPAAPSVAVACPDARPPAYQAAIALARAGRLDRFATGYYHRGPSPLTRLAERVAPRVAAALEKRFARRHHAEIPPDRVRSFPSFDVSLAIEARAGSSARAALARGRTRRFDRAVAEGLRRERPDVLLAFSDVASGFALPLCRRLGIPAVVSVVHGDVREEVEVLERERERSPEFFSIYLGDGPVDRRELSWLHDRRERDRELAARLLVPSEHIARLLVRRGTDPGRVAVVPYAADTRRFSPRQDKAHGRDPFFLFAGGITQRKGIGYLLRAWAKVRRPGWRLGLLGGLPRDTSALEPYRDQVEFLGRVGHAEMPALMASADVFAFPSLFEGSAVVTYEALASGLPLIVTAEAGSVARDGREGFVVPAGDVDALAERLGRIGEDADLRAEMAAAARRRALEFDWPRYHRAIVEATDRAAV